MASSRVPEIDILKGVALVGILLVNLSAFATGVFGNVPGGSLLAQTASRDVAALLVSWLVQSKFVMIFSFLLGWSVHTQAGQEGTFRRRFLRRQLGLLVLGTLHGVFFFSGDILASYAVLGLFMLRPVGGGWDVRRVLRSVALLTTVGATLLTLMVAAMLAFPSGSDGPLFSQAAAIYARGTFLEVSHQRALELLVQTPMVVLFLGPVTLAMMRLGYAAALAFAPSGLAHARPLARRTLAMLLVPGLAGNALCAWGSFEGGNLALVASFAQALLFGPMLAVAYVAAAVLLLTPAVAARLGPTLGASGSISLSVYLAQSVLMSIIFCGYGLGLFGKLPTWAGILVCLGVQSVLAAAASLWLRAFRTGPAESMLRSFTDWRLVGIRHAPRQSHV